MRNALLGALVGCLLTTGAFLTREAMDAFAKLKARVTVIEQFLAAVTRQ